jgi:hypothetical protein
MVIVCRFVVVVPALCQGGKMKRLITASLIALIALTPFRQERAKAADPNALLPAMCALVVIGIGIVVVYEMVKLCKKMDQRDQEQKDPPDTNKVNRAQSVMPPGNHMTLTDASVNAYDCSEFGMADPYSGSLITTRSCGILQSSTDLANWSEEYSFTGWTSADGTMMLWTKQGIPVMTNYVPIFGTNVLSLPICSATEPRKFYRVTGN